MMTINAFYSISQPCRTCSIKLNLKFSFNATIMLTIYEVIKNLLLKFYFNCGHVLRVSVFQLRRIVIIIVDSNLQNAYVILYHRSIMNFKWILQNPLNDKKRIIYDQQRHWLSVLNPWQWFCDSRLQVKFWSFNGKNWNRCKTSISTGGC